MPQKQHDLHPKESLLICNHMGWAVSDASWRQKMLFYFLIIFGLYGWIEFEALIVIGNEIGGLASFLGIFVTAFIGMALLKSQGRAVMESWQQNLARGAGETAPLVSGLSLLVGAFLMLLPGYVTDGLGILCFIPGLRQIIGQAILSRFQASAMQNGFHSRFTTRFYSNQQNRPSPDQYPTSDQPMKNLDGDIIEGDFKKKD